MHKIISVIFSLLLCFSASAKNESEEISRSKEIVRTSANPKRLVGAYNDLAWEYYYTDYDSSLYYTKKAIQLANKIKDPYWQAVSLEMLAILKEMSGQLEESLKLYFQVIDLRETLGGEGLENTYNNMAVVFQNQGNNQKALEYFTKSYNLEVLKGNTLGIIECQINRALSLKNLSLLDSVPDLLKNAIVMANEIQENNLTIDASINLANYFTLIAEYDSALHYFQLGKSLAEKEQNLRSLASATFGLAGLYIELNNDSLALNYLDQSEKLGNQINSIKFLQQAYQAKSDFHKKRGQLEEALEYLQKSMIAKDSLLNIEIIQMTNNLERKFATEQKERQIAELQLAATEQNLQSIETRNHRKILFFLALILIMILGFVSYRYFNQQKTSKILAQKNKTIEIALNDREILLKEIHHRVKNNLQVVSSLLSIQGRGIKDEKALEAVNESKHRVQAMSLIHQYLYGEDNLKNIDIQKYVTQLGTNLFNAYKLDHDQVQLKTEIDPILLDVDTAIPLGLIINELISNSLKYAFPDGREGCVEIILKEKEGELKLKVADNGVGFSNNYSNTSFGMKMLNAFKNKLQAEIEINNSEGVEVIYSIKKYKGIWHANLAS